MPSLSYPQVRPSIQAGDPLTSDTPALVLALQTSRAPAAAEQSTVTRASLSAKVPRQPSATQTPLASKPQVLPNAQLPSPVCRISTTPFAVSASQVLRSPAPAPQSMVRCTGAGGGVACTVVACAHASAPETVIAATRLAARSGPL